MMSEEELYKLSEEIKKIEIYFDTGNVVKNLANANAIRQLSEDKLDIDTSFTIDFNEEDLI